jgi:hypothetical protein
MNTEVQFLLRQMVQLIIDNTRNMGGLDDERSHPEIDRVVSAYASTLRLVSPEEEQAANLRRATDRRP